MDENENAPRYIVDLESTNDHRHSVSALIASRRCYSCRQGDTTESLQDSHAQDHVKQIAQQCANTSDYLLPDTTLMESIFRVILAGGNEPKTAEEISEELSSRWTMSAYPRNLSAKVIGRLLKYSEVYLITALPIPEPGTEVGTEESADVEGPTLGKKQKRVKRPAKTSRTKE